VVQYAFKKHISEERTPEGGRKEEDLAGLITEKRFGIGGHCLGRGATQPEEVRGKG